MATNLQQTSKTTLQKPCWKLSFRLKVFQTANAKIANIYIKFWKNNIFRQPSSQSAWYYFARLIIFAWIVFPLNPRCREALIIHQGSGRRRIYSNAYYSYGKLVLETEVKSRENKGKKHTHRLCFVFHVCKIPSNQIVSSLSSHKEIHTGNFCMLKN